MAARDQIDRSTPATLIARAANDLAGRLRRTESRIRRAWLRPIAWALGQAHYDLRGFLAWAIAQIHPDEAEEDRLDAWATFWQVPRTAAAAATSTTLTFTGTPATAVPIGTIIERDDGWTYTTDAGVVIGGGGTVTVAATSEDVGEDGNLTAGATLTLQTPIAGVDDTVTVTAAFTGGADAETDRALRTRVLARIREETEGGTAAHYIAWAREALPTLRAAWVVPGAGRLNQRILYFIVNGAGLASIPTAGNVTTVQTALNLRRPVTHIIDVEAAGYVPVDMTIHLYDDTLTHREAVEAELAALFAREAGNRETDGTVLLLNSEVRNAIGRGVAAFTLTDILGLGPLTDLPITASAVPILGTITWT